MLKFITRSFSITFNSNKIGAGRLRPWHDSTKTSYQRDKEHIVGITSIGGTQTIHKYYKNTFKGHKLLSIKAIVHKLSTLVKSFRTIRTHIQLAQSIQGLGTIVPELATKDIRRK